MNAPRGSEAADAEQGQAEVRWPSPGISFGGDYNPEQWDEDTWRQDTSLMREAGVNLVTVGVFAWARLEPRPGVYELGWLERVMDLLADAGIGVDLATPTTCPPAWLYRQHPEIRLVDPHGHALGAGSRQAWSPSSATYRQYALRIVEQLATRLGAHPALRMWHVGNELGAHNARCYSEESAEAFRRWLRARYDDLEALNAAWGTAFWGQGYGAWQEIDPPRATPTFHNPTHELDFARFSSDALLDHLRAECALLRRLTPQVPVTTNFMVMEPFSAANYAQWADQLDLVSNDHYVVPEADLAHHELAFSADRVRGLSGGRPWLLMEHSTGAVNWQGVNLPKEPGQLLRHSVSHVARGADGVLFFQWRASRYGAERFHSAMLPHAGTDTRIWREVRDLGVALTKLAELRGTRTEPAPVAIAFDHEAWWASEHPCNPSDALPYTEAPRAVHRSLVALGVPVDVVPPGTDFSPYRAAIVPGLFLTASATARRLEQFVHDGGHLMVTYLSGLVDENSHVIAGPYPGAFHRLLGIHGEELRPLRPGDAVQLDTGWRGTLWTEEITLRDADVVARYVAGPLDGRPAVTARRVESRGPDDGVSGPGGSAWYLSTRLDLAGLRQLLADFLQGAGVTPHLTWPEGVEIVRRVAPDRRYAFVINHSDRRVDVPLDGLEMLSGQHCHGITVAAGGVAVVREEP